MSSNLTQPTDVIIIGGGVIGLSLAWELIQRGRSVRVLEAERMGRGASWAGAGILPPAAKCGASEPYEMLRALSHSLHPAWAKRLLDATGIDTGFRRCGGIYLARSAGEAASLLANQSWWDAHGISHENWTPEQLAAREPALRRQDLRAVWYLPDECQLRNPRHLKALTNACQNGGAELVEFASVQRLEDQQGRVVAVETETATHRAEQICICSGAWARRNLEQFGIAVGILPVRGQMLLYQCGQPLLSSVVNEGHRYLVPRDDGRLLAGSVEEEVGYQIETTPAGISLIKNWAEQVLPGLQHCAIEKTWAGLRPGSFDGMPYIGRVPGFENLFMAAGHFRSGLHLSCATAILMANEMQGIPNDIDLRPFRVGRG